MGNIIVVGILLIVLGVSIVSMVKDRKNGKSNHCCGNCSGCERYCHK